MSFISQNRTMMLCAGKTEGIDPLYYQLCKKNLVCLGSSSGLRTKVNNPIKKSPLSMKEAFSWASLGVVSGPGSKTGKKVKAMSA